MTRLFSNLVAFTVAVTSIGATAQDFHSQPLPGHSRLFDHDYWYHETHIPDVAQLDAYADQLAKLARHLHEDAHKLSQDYEHSESIEIYVDQVDRLQQHMHEILHEAAEAGTHSTALTSHVKSDLRQVKGLMNRLNFELHHQAYDGARTEDFHAMDHMRQIIRDDALPLIRQMEECLYGHASHHYLHSFHSRPLGGHSGREQRFRFGH